MNIKDSYKRFADGEAFKEILEVVERKFGPDCQVAVVAEKVIHRVWLWTQSVKTAIQIGIHVKDEAARADWCEAMILAWSDYVVQIDETRDAEKLVEAYLRIARLHRWGMDLVGGRDGVLKNIEADRAPITVPLRIPEPGMAVLGLKTKTMGWKDNDYDRHREQERKVQRNA